MDHDQYIVEWGKQLGLKPPKNTAWDVCEYMVNVNKNYSTAIAILFGLSWHKNRDYMQRAEDDLRATIAQWPKETYWDATKLYEFYTYYIKDVEELPK